MDDQSLHSRTVDICHQLDRYGGGVFCSEIADALEIIADINDDMHHFRERNGIIKSIESAKEALDNLSLKLIESPEFE